MAVLTARSTQLTNPTATGDRLRLFPIDSLGKFRALAFEFPTGSAAGDAGSTIELVKLPEGRQRILPSESRFWCSAGGAGVTMNIGIRAYYYDNIGRKILPKDPVALASGISIAAAQDNVILNASMWKSDLMPVEGVVEAGVTSSVTAGANGPHVYATFPQGFPANFLLRGYIRLILE